MNKLDHLSLIALAAVGSGASGSGFVIPNGKPAREHDPRSKPQKEHDPEALASAIRKRGRKALKALQSAAKGAVRIAEKTRWQLENGARR